MKSGDVLKKSETDFYEILSIKGEKAVVKYNNRTEVTVLVKTLQEQIDNRSYDLIEKY